VLRRALRGCVRWIERAAFAVGVVCLAWVFVTWKHAAFYQISARRQIADMASAAPAPDPLTVPVPFTAGGLRDNGLIGVLEVPRIELSVALVDSVDPRALRLAAGHVPSTPWPWASGNAAFAAHRDTFFRPLGRVRDGDQLTVRTRHGVFRYRVLRTLVVAPEDVWVLDPPGEAVDLTLVTCYPFTYVGAAPRRFIVHATRIAMEGTS
jgi:sortase A